MDKMHNKIIASFKPEELDKLDMNQDDNNQDNNNSNGEFYQSILNTFIQYYKKTYPEKQLSSLFHNIDLNDPTSTNHCMELFFEEITKYNKIDNKIYINTFNKNKEDIIYGLQINGEIKGISLSIITLIIEIIEKYKNIENTNWNIICLS
jgi:hypothetical protein